MADMREVLAVQFARILASVAETLVTARREAGPDVADALTARIAFDMASLAWDALRVPEGAPRH